MSSFTHLSCIFLAILLISTYVSCQPPPSTTTQAPTSQALLVLFVNQNETIKTVTTNSFTISFFAKLEKYKGLIVNIFSFSSRGHEEVNEIILEVNYDNGHTNLFIHGYSATFSAVPPLDEWAHICIAWESTTGNIDLYINGEKVNIQGTEVPNNYELGEDGFYKIGRDQAEIIAKTGVYGKWTLFNLWNRVLTQNEVIQAYNCKLKGDTFSFYGSHWEVLNEVQSHSMENPCKRQEASECDCQTSTLENYSKIDLLLNFMMKDEKEMDEVKQNITSISEKCELNARDVSTLQQNYNVWEKDIEGIKQRISVCEQDTKNMKDSTDSFEQDIVGLNQKTAGCELELQRQKNKSEGNEQDIIYLKEKNLVYEQEISDLKQKTEICQQCEEKLSDLQKRIEDLERDLGNQIKASKICPSHFTNIEGHCYLFDSSPSKSWSEAAQYCKSLDPKSNLLSLESEEEWNIVKGYLMKNENLNTTAWWISGSDQAKEGDWMWTGTNRPFTFTAWCKGEPNNLLNVENCALIWFQGELCWNDGTCSSNINLICEAE